MTHVNKCEHILWSCIWWAFLRDFFIRFCWLFVWCLAIVLILLLFELTLSLLFTWSPPLLLYFACKVEQIINLIFISYPIWLTFTAEWIPSLLSNIGISFLHLFIFTFSLLVISLFLIFFLFILWKIPYPVKITGPSHTFSIVPWGSLLLNLLLWLIVFLFLLLCSSFVYNVFYLSDVVAFDSTSRYIWVPQKVMLIMGALFYVNISLFHRSSFVLVKFDLKVGCLGVSIFTALCSIVQSRAYPV